VTRLFKVEQRTPDVQGEDQATAAAVLHTHEQAVGNVSTVRQQTGAESGTVVAQTPAPGAPIARGEAVHLAVQGDAADGHDEPS
jgi:beta-lactam-binding protein with PASTA domain